jgi:predicted NAD/FAD-dependent oxidoreductase
MKGIVIGGGIGGIATALSLHAVGIECEVFGQSRGIRRLGVREKLCRLRNSSTSNSIGLTQPKHER